MPYFEMFKSQYDTGLVTVWLGLIVFMSAALSFGVFYVRNKGRKTRISYMSTVMTITAIGFMLSWFATPTYQMVDASYLQLANNIHDYTITTTGGDTIQSDTSCFQQAELKYCDFDGLAVEVSAFEVVQNEQIQGELILPAIGDEPNDAVSVMSLRVSD